MLTLRGDIGPLCAWGGTFMEHPTWLTMDDEAFEAMPRGASAQSGPYLGQVLARALREHLAVVPGEESLRGKPILLRLRPPLPLRVRLYLFRATQHASERQAGTFRIQLTVGEPVPHSERRRFRFDRSDNVRCLLAGYHAELRTFILWDADMQDAGGGYPWSKGVQAPPSVVFGAVARGIAEEVRQLRRPNRVETIIAARSGHLAEAIERRVSLSLHSISGEVLPGC
ncbi:hypothetical protein ACIPPS_31865 [Streptomyces sp. NPDC090127]|uniref:hypothetical protein n=1 Tax=Streptomyces sp. NPDC090127 TaxID=3365953 RepID=UPI00380F0D70